MVEESQDSDSSLISRIPLQAAQVILRRRVDSPKEIGRHKRDSFWRLEK